jgi:hypothetical protein
VSLIVIDLRSEFCNQGERVLYKRLPAAIGGQSGKLTAFPEAFVVLPGRSIQLAGIRVVVALTSYQNT